MIVNSENRFNSFVYCPVCHEKISSRVIVIVEADCEGYWAFDSLHCAKKYYESFGFNGTPPLTDLELSSLLAKAQRTTGWKISKYTVKNFKLLYNKEKLDD